MDATAWATIALVVVTIYYAWQLKHQNMRLDTQAKIECIMILEGRKTELYELLN